ncbi:MAG: hypothetical protein ACJ75S_00905 [Solirubrobacterales bacterium]
MPRTAPGYGRRVAERGARRVERIERETADAVTVVSATTSCGSIRIRSGTSHVHEHPRHNVLLAAFFEWGVAFKGELKGMASEARSQIVKGPT